MSKVLVTDDCEENRRICALNLGMISGHQILEAKDGSTCLRIAQAEQPDVILLDIMMPGIDGFETLQALQENEGTTSIPVMMLTAVTDKNNTVKALNLGAQDYLTKPFDIAEMKTRTERLIQMNEKQKAMQHDAALGEMTSAITHDLRSVFMNMMLLTSVQRIFENASLSGKDRTTVKVFFQGLENNIPIALQMCQSVTEFKSGIRFPASLQNLGALLETPLGILQKQLNGIKLKKDLPARPVMVKCKSCEIQRIVLTLTKNAIEAIKEGWPEKPCIKIKLWTKNNLAFLSITDNGCGISPEKQNRIFEKLFSTKTTGNGLGLNSSKKIAKEHGGEIVFESKNGQTTFTIILPLAEDK